MRTKEQQTFTEELIYKLIPENHYLVKLDEIVKWYKYEKKIKKYWYKWEWDLWQPMIRPRIILKMLFLTFLYDTSEREIEDRVNFDIVLKYFCELSPEERAPYHSTLSRFKNRILEANKLTKRNILKDMFQDILKVWKKQGLSPSKLRIIDAWHMEANVNTDKENKKKKDQEKKWEKHEARDRDAKWWCKKSIKVDKDRKINKWFYWYKEHTNYDPLSDLITEIKLTSWNRHDWKYLQELTKQELKRWTKIKIYTADKAYDDGENREFLKENNIEDWIIMKDRRLKKKDKNKEVWEKLKENPWYKYAIKKRKLIEKIYWDQKKWHWLWKCKYLWISKTKIQVYITAMVFNLKSIIKHAFWVRLRNQKYLYW